MISETVVNWKHGNTWCRIAGDVRAGGVPLVVVHGGPGMSWEYLADHDKLAADGRAVVYYDQLGSSRSKPLHDAAWTPEIFVRELEAVVAGLGLREFDLLGHSWGASVAIDFAAGRVRGLRKLVLYSATASTELLISEWRRLLRDLPGVDLATIEHLERTGNTAAPEYRSACEQFERKHFCTTELPASLQRSMANLAVDVYSQLWGQEQFRCTGALKVWDASGRLAAIDSPTLVLSGQFDQATVACAEAIAQGLPDGRMETLAGASHMAHFETPEPYFSAVRRFLS